MAKEIVTIPDLGTDDEVDVIEISVAPGDQITEEQGLLVLESDKATMDVPSPVAGKVVRILVKEGDSVKTGSEIVEVELDGDTEAAAEGDSAATDDDKSEDGKAGQGKPGADEAEAQPEASQQPTQQESTQQEPRTSAPAQDEVFELPDLGTEDQVDVIELSVAVGDQVEEGQALGMLESDKATMDVPAPYAAEVVELLVKEGDKVGAGTPFAKLRRQAAEEDAAAADAPATGKEPSAKEEPSAKKGPSAEKDMPADDEKAKPDSSSGAAATGRTERSAPRPPEPLPAEPDAPHESEGGKIYAGPAVRHMARELGVPLERVKGSGPKGRIQKDDLTRFVKEAVGRSEVPSAGGAGLPPVPDVDFSQFGETELVPMTKIQSLTATNMQRAWLNAPHVTHFDSADITDLEKFRKSLKDESERRNVKVTPLPFLLMASARALRAHSQFNRSLHSDGKHFVQKHYVHIGMAVDTPRGLLVPVIRDVDQKGLWELAEEAAELAKKARDGKLSAAEMQGGSFTISSLGAIGGTGFTPIINVPEVSILAVSRAEIRPVWNGKKFVPRQMLPLSLSYDHRAVNGADAGRFMTYLTEVLGDLRRLLL